MISKDIKPGTKVIDNRLSVYVFKRYIESTAKDMIALVSKNGSNYLFFRKDLTEIIDK